MSNQEAIAIGTTSFFIGNLYKLNVVIKMISAINDEKY